MTLNILVSNGNVVFVTLKQLKIWLHNIHLLLDFIPPQNVPILFVDLNGVSYGLQNLVAVLMRLLSVFSGCLGYDKVPILQGVFIPPLKVWFFN